MLHAGQQCVVGEIGAAGAIGLHHIRHPGLVARLAAAGALLSVGYAATLPFMNVFFQEHLHADEAEIGTTFATASLLVAIGSLFAPLISRRLGRVRGVTVARLAAVPVVLSLGLALESAGTERRRWTSS